MTKNRLLIDNSNVDTAIYEMAQQINNDFADIKPLFVALLRGAAPFASKLMFAIQRQNPEFHPELDYMMVSTYGGGRTAGEPHIVTDLAPDTIAKDRTVVILDDVFDKGVTVNFVMHHLLARGAKAVKVAVLVNKKTKKHFDINVDYCCFDLEDVWLVGMGMDDAGTAKEYGRWQGFIEAKVS